MRVIACMFAVMLAGIGCSKTFMCHLNGSQCPAGQAPASSSSEETPTSEPAAESEPAKEQEAAPAPAKSDCLATGTKTDNYHRCCCDCAKTQIEASENTFTCG